MNEARGWGALYIEVAEGVLQERLEDWSKRRVVSHILLVVVRVLVTTNKK